MSVCVCVCCVLSFSVHIICPVSYTEVMCIGIVCVAVVEQL